MYFIVKYKNFKIDIILFCVMLRHFLFAFCEVTLSQYTNFVSVWNSHVTEDYVIIGTINYTYVLANIICFQVILKGRTNESFVNINFHYPVYPILLLSS